ncbi:HNH endonuclease [Nitrosomonas sp.]|uniref:HNH endonuclease n=1 Tax=Nitrosomonas sp. TaxID=42353 RepID=UPI0025ED7075|nr:HNH endonuclease [Nitrosomonas sp.]MBY0483474.1 HNH endonuclease [Nitrosomonas sp.]
MKICPSFQGYSATSDGSIVSHRRRGVRVPGHGGTKSVIDYDHNYLLSQLTTKKGYKTVCIMLENGKTRPVGVHRMVADAYHGVCPTGLQVRHIDGNASNNTPDNLCYGDALQNASDRILHGRYKSGSEHHNSKLTKQQVEDIKIRRSSGVKVKDLALANGVSIATIEAVIYGKHYKVISK